MPPCHLQVNAGPAKVPNLGSPIKKVEDNNFALSFDETNATACKLISMSRGFPDETAGNETASNETASTIKDSSEEESLEKTRLLFENDDDENDDENGAEQPHNSMGAISTCRPSTNLLSRTSALLLSAYHHVAPPPSIMSTSRT